MKKYAALMMILTLGACAMPVLPTQNVAIVPVPVVVKATEKAEKPDNSPIHVCTIKPFFETYRAENTSRGKAKLAVQKQCLAKNEAMFCEESAIVCQTYE